MVDQGKGAEKKMNGNPDGSGYSENDNKFVGLAMFKTLENNGSTEKRKWGSICTNISHGWMVLALVVTLGLIFLIFGILTGILFRHYSAMNNEISVLKSNGSDGDMKSDVSELWKSVSNIMGDLSKIKDKEDTSEGSCTTCPLGWNLIRSNCYYFSSSVETWERSKQLCAEGNGILLVIKDYVEMSAVLSTIPPGHYWIGLKRHPGDFGMWVWTDGSPLTFSAWDKGEPNNAFDREDCVQFVTGVRSWNDYPCSVNLNYICKGVWTC